MAFPVINFLKNWKQNFIFVYYDYLIIVIMNSVILFTDYCIAVYLLFYGPKANQLFL